VSKRLEDYSYCRPVNNCNIRLQTKPGVYEIRMVKTGIVANDAVEIIPGLEAGNVVVTSGAYLLNSEYIFKNGPDITN